MRSFATICAAAICIATGAAAMGVTVPPTGEWLDRAAEQTGLKPNRAGFDLGLSTDRGKPRTTFYVEIDHRFTRSTGCGEFQNRKSMLASEPFCVAFAQDYKAMVESPQAMQGERGFELRFRDASADTGLRTAPGRMCKVALSDIEICSDYFTANGMLP